MKDTQATPKPPPCPICKAPREDRWRPFCSKRCSDIDLGRWMTGRYAVPVFEEEPPDELN